MGERRLNPLAFPAETNGRFTILIVTAIILTWLIGFMFLAFLVLLLRTSSPLVEVLQSITSATSIAAGSNIQELPPETLAVYYGNLRAPLINAWLVAIPWILIPLAVVLLLLSIAWLIYRSHPQRIVARHQHNFEASDEPSVAELQEAVKGMAVQAGLLPIPHFLIHKLANPEYPDGQAFGLPNNPQVRLNVQNLFLRQEKRPQFQALVFHEFGHIANDDVWRTYFASALWITFSGILLFMAVIMVVFALLQPIQTGVIGFALWPLLSRIMITLLLAMGIWRSVVQVREFYADWWAASFVQPAILHQWLTGISAKEEKLWWRPFAPYRKSWWQQLRLFHPSAKERAEVLAEPLKLFRINRQMPFFTGVLLATAMIGIPFMVGWLSLPFIGLIEIGLAFWASSLFQSANSENVSLFILVNFVLKGFPLFLLSSSVLIYIGYLLTKTIGIQVQRETIADMENQVMRLRSYGRLAKSAGWLSAGIQVGLFLIPVGYTFPTTWQSAALTIGWFTLFFLMTWLWLAYIRALTQIVLGAHVGRADPKRGKRLITILSSLSLAILYPPAFLLLILSWISQYAVSLPLTSGPDMSSTEFVAVTFVLLIFLAVTWFLGAVLSLIFLYMVLAARPAAMCPNCGENLVPKIVLGQSCTYCHEPVSLWIYVEEKKDVAVQ